MIKSPEINIEPMSNDDIGYAHNLTELENWGYLENDMRRLLSWEPDGCFIARRGKERVGMVTTTTYDDFAFLGTLIVDRQERGQGTGTALMKSALEYLKGRAVGAIELDGVIQALPLYRRLGFIDKYLSLRFVRPAFHSEVNIPIYNPERIESIIELDKALTGLNRARMLSDYFKTTPENIYALQDEDLRAYALVRPRTDGTTVIGPLVGKSLKIAEKLLIALIGNFGDRPLSIGVPSVNYAAVELAVKLGFQYCLPSLRMYSGKKLDYEKNIYGIFSAEKG